MLLSSWLETLWNTVALDALATDSERQDEIDVLQRLREECSAGRQLAGWTVGMFAGQLGDPGHLNLMTLHSCKGLEFDVVVMIGMDQGIIPSWADASEAAKREPRRLFYVGMTRAKHEVYMAYSGFTVDRYERRHENGPSEFLLELQEALRRP